MTKPDITARVTPRISIQNPRTRLSEPQPLSAGFPQDNIVPLEGNVTLSKETTKTPKTTSICSPEFQVLEDIPNSITKTTDVQAQDMQSSVLSGISSDLVPRNSAPSPLGIRLKTQNAVSRSQSFLTPRPSSSKVSPSRRSLIPFDPFFSAIKPIEKKSIDLCIQSTLEGENYHDARVDQEGKKTEFPHEPEIGDYLTEYGLHVIERDPIDLKVTWLGCKFCPLYGSRKRQKKYLMVFQRPFSSQAFIRHLGKSHQRTWDIYKKGSREAQNKFFEGRTLPSQFLFSLRIVQLKNSDKRFGEKTPEQERISELPGKIKTKRSDVYREIADKEAAENESRLATLKESIPSKSQDVVDEKDMGKRTETLHKAGDQKNSKDGKKILKPNFLTKFAITRIPRIEFEEDIQSVDLQEDNYAETRCVELQEEDKLVPRVLAFFSMEERLP
ncbi:unnamed protein product [Agarophyton chilense]